MSRQRFVSVAPMTIWFWLILFACFGLAVSASLKCRACKTEDACAKDTEEVDCETSQGPLPPGQGQKYACGTTTDGGKKGKVQTKACSIVPDAVTDDCNDNTNACYCFTDNCNGSTGSKSKSSTLTPWNFLFWVGLGLACVYTSILH